MKDYINFAYHYDKLNKDVFPTLRGLGAYTDYSKGRVIKVLLNRKLFCHVELISKKKMRILDMSLPFLIKDTSRPGVPNIKSRQEFIDGMNKFRTHNKIETPRQRLTVLWFKKVKKYNYGIGEYI